MDTKPLATDPKNMAAALLGCRASWRAVVRVWRLERRTLTWKPLWARLSLASTAKPYNPGPKPQLETPDSQDCHKRLCLYSQVSQSHVCYFDFGSRHPKPPQRLCLYSQVFQSHVCYLDFGSRHPRPPQRLCLHSQVSQSHVCYSDFGSKYPRGFASTVKSPKTNATSSVCADAQDSPNCCACG